MTARPDALMQALDRASAPVRFFIRDDDAGWDDDRLAALLDTTAAAGVPIDLAVIPDALTPGLNRQLQQRMDTQPLGLHQHGCSHHNHEASGRKCEFGPSRPAQARQHDLQRGQRQLQRAFGARLDPIFTPPWNRCTDDTPAQLAALGFAALSRDAGAPAQQALTELPIHTDWTREQRLAAEAATDASEKIAVQMARYVGGSHAVGLMLHHAVMDDDELAQLRALLQRWAAHPNARWVGMRSLLPGAST
jgi:peptidoglycan/xylan/chitin deacetylase (PgdA/CDA1 family)